MRLDGLSGEVLGMPLGQVLPPIVVCHEKHRFLIAEQLESIERRAARIILEPVGRNTAPALTLAALHAVSAEGDAVLLAMPADHVIENRAQFQEVIASGFEHAVAGNIVAFGVVPTHPETGYGYIRRGAPTGNGTVGFAVEAFVEKPDRETAIGYLDSGTYYWNGGLFMVRASTWLQAVDRHCSEIATACRVAYDRGQADVDFFRLERDAFIGCASDSIDYAVMERLNRGSEAGASASPPGDALDDAALPPVRGVVVPLDAGWSDIGSWPAVLALNEPNDDGNVVHGDVYSLDSHGSLVAAEHRFVATVGMRDVIVVETADAVLVAHRDHSQEVKKVVDWLKAQGRDEGHSHRRVYRPWGSFEQLDAGERYQVKRLTIKPGQVLSLQMHHHRAEHWIVVRGTAKVTRGEEEFLLSENQSTYIPLGVTHRLENPGSLTLEVIEVQSGSYLGEDDIVRFEDRYLRDTSD